MTLVTEDALLYPESTRSLLSFKDIRSNGFHVESSDEDSSEYLTITKKEGQSKKQLDKLSSLSSGHYYAHIRTPIVCTALKTTFSSSELFCLWHDILGHPGLRMMRNIISNSVGHNLNINNFPNHEDFVCRACALGKLIDPTQ